MDQSLLAEEAKRGIRPCQIWVDSWKEARKQEKKKVSQSVSEAQEVINYSSKDERISTLEVSL